MFPASATVYLAPGVDNTEFWWIFMVDITAESALVSPSCGDWSPPAVILVLHGLAVFSGQCAATVHG